VPLPAHTIPIPNVARRLVLSLGEMERRVLQRMLSLAALFACAASVSCGPGVYDRDGEQSTTKLVGSGGGEIEFMGATLAIAPGSMKSDTPVPIKYRSPSAGHVRERPDDHHSDDAGHCGRELQYDRFHGAGDRGLGA